MMRHAAPAPPSDVQGTGHTFAWCGRTPCACGESTDACGRAIGFAVLALQVAVYEGR